MRDTVFTRFRRWFQNNFVFFGPGLLLAITAAGEAGVTEAIEIGAHYGPALIWVVIIPSSSNTHSPTGSPVILLRRTRRSSMR